MVEGRTDIAVEADLTQIVNMDTKPAYVPVTLKSVSGISEEDVTIIPKTIPVTIEDTATKEFLISGMAYRNTGKRLCSRRMQYRSGEDPDSGSGISGK